MSLSVSLSHSILEIRDFPRYNVNDEKILGNLDVGLMNCKNLSTFIWTREVSINSSVLSTVQASCSQLQTLTVNGGSSFNPQILLGFTGLRRIGLIMPDTKTITGLGTWLSMDRTPLLSLDIICKVRISKYKRE